MRNPKRIYTVMEALMRLWFQYPDLRLGQLISIMTGGDPFDVEDYDLIKRGYDKLDKDEITLLDVSWPEYWIEPNAFKELIEDINSGKFALSTRLRKGGEME